MIPGFTTQVFLLTFLFSPVVLKDCIEDVAEQMSDLMDIGTRPKLSQIIPNLAPISISGCDMPFSQSVRNLGFT